MNPVSEEAFDIFSHGEMSKCVSSGVKNDCESGTWSSALVSNDVHVPLVKAFFLPYKKDKDAAAAAELLFDNGRRKPLERSGQNGCCKDGAVRDQQ